MDVWLLWPSFVLFVFDLPRAVGVDFTVTSSYGSVEILDGTPTWAVDVPSLTVKITTTPFTNSLTTRITVTHQLQDGSTAASCDVIAVSAGTCFRDCTPPANFGVACSRTSSTPMEITMTIGGLDVTRNQSKITLTLDNVIPDWNYNPDDSLITLKECVDTAFEGAEAIGGVGTCGFGCDKQFNCSVQGYLGGLLHRTCTALAVWNDTTNLCSKPCDNNFFDFATANLPAVVGEGGTKDFTCDECPPSHMFSRTCGPGGRWINETNPCSPACNISEIACGSPKGHAPFCPGNHTFSCPNGSCFEDTIECLPKTGNWSRTECVCLTGLTIGQILASVFGITWGIVFGIDVIFLWMRNKLLIEAFKEAVREAVKAELEAARTSDPVAAVELQRKAEDARKKADKAEETLKEAMKTLGMRSKLLIEALKKAVTARLTPDEPEEKVVEAEKKVEEATKNLEYAWLLSTYKVVTPAVVSPLVTIICVPVLCLCPVHKEVAWGITGALLILNNLALIIFIPLIRKGHFDAEGMIPPKSPKNKKVSPGPEFGQSLL